MDRMTIIDTVKDEMIEYNSSVQFNYGTNSPYPGDNQAPVPSASFQVAGDELDNLYRMDNTAQIEHNRAGLGDADILFSGRFSTTSDAPVSGMNIAHQSNELNKEIQSWPVLPTSPNWSNGDTSNGRRTIVGALRHWYAECNLTEFGVRGDFLFNTSNMLPGVAYYDHPTMRFIPWYETTPYHRIVWDRTTPYSSDSGAPFEVGDSVTLAMRLNNMYGDPAQGELPAQADSCSLFFDLASGKIRKGLNDENISGIARIGFDWNYLKHTLQVSERNQSDNSESTMDITDNLPGYMDTPRMITLTMTRLSATDVEMYVEFYHRNGITDITYVSTVDLLPTSIAVTRVWAEAYISDHKESPALDFEGVLGIYVTKGKTFEYDERDAFPIDVEYFNRPEWKDVIFPAISGNAWSMIYDLCSVYNLEFNPVHNTFKANSGANTQEAMVTGQGSNVVVQASTREMAETVEIVNYNYASTKAWDNNIAIFKADQVYTVALGERLEETITLEDGAGALFISQPVCVRVPTAIRYWNLPKGAAMPSFYSVYDDDNLEVDPNSWNRSGGSVSVERGENPQELKLIIQAPSNDLISKETNFHLSIAGSDIPSLIISGNGLIAKKETLRVKTGAGKSRNLKVVGETYDNQMVSSSGIAWDVAQKLASRYGTTRTTASGNFPATDNHKFTLTPILKGGSFYKPTNITDSPNGMSMSEAVRYNPISWVKDNFKGLTCAQYEALWEEDTLCREVNLSPLGSRGKHF